VTLEKLKSAIFIAGSCIFQFSLETASVGAVKASTLLNARKERASPLVRAAAFLFDSNREIRSAKEFSYSGTLRSGNV
jgi:hypothetical protein